MINIKPLRDLVLLKPLPVQSNSIIDQSLTARSNVGEVLRTGAHVVGIGIGVIVYFRAYSGHELIINEQRLQLVPLRDVLGIVEEDSSHVATSVGS